MLLLFLFAEDEVNLLVIVVDTNPIWWGKQALKGSQVRWLEPSRDSLHLQYACVPPTTLQAVLSLPRLGVVALVQS